MHSVMISFYVDPIPSCLWLPKYLIWIIQEVKITWSQY